MFQRAGLSVERLRFAAVVLAAGLGLGCSTSGSNTNGGDGGAGADGASPGWICTAKDLCCPLAELICEGNPDDGLYCRCPSGETPRADGGGGSATDAGVDHAQDAAAGADGAQPTDAGSSSPDGAAGGSDSGAGSGDAGSTYTDGAIDAGTGSECRDECPALEATRCTVDGKRVRTCQNHDDDPCLEWGPATRCPFGCSAGQCNPPPPSCNDTCPELGATACCSDSRLICRDDNGDGCLEWSYDVWCPDTCAKGECL